MALYWYMFAEFDKKIDLFNSFFEFDFVLGRFWGNKVDLVWFTFCHRLTNPLIQNIINQPLPLETRRLNIFGLLTIKIYLIVVLCTCTNSWARKRLLCHQCLHRYTVGLVADVCKLQTQHSYYVYMDELSLWAARLTGPTTCDYIDFYLCMPILYTLRTVSSLGLNYASIL